MAIHWLIDSRYQLIEVTAEGNFTAAEVHDYMTRIAGANALHYRQLLDFSQSTIQLTPDEAMGLGVQIRIHQMQSTAGPLAVVMPQEHSGLIARLLGIMATAPRPMRLFPEREDAIKWLTEFAAGSSSQPIPEPRSRAAQKPACI